MMKMDPSPSMPPHPVLPDYYGGLQDRSAYVRRLFNRAAADYDDVTAIFSLGSGRWYRRQALRRAGLRAGMRVLDVAVGTGLVAREAQALTGAAGAVIGLDLSENMLAETRRALALSCVQARAEALPIAENSIDFISMGYALRHVPDLLQAFSGFFHALRPSGTLLLLEISRPSSNAVGALARLYFHHFVPALCRLRGYQSAAELLGYCWDTIDACVPPDVILATLRQAGFADVSCEVSVGVFRAYTGRKPPPS